MINPETGEALVTFPCLFLFKVTGKNEASFKSDMIKLLNQVDPSLNELRVTETYSKTEKYISLSIQLHCEMQNHIDQAYNLLKSDARVLWAL